MSGKWSGDRKKYKVGKLVYLLSGRGRRLLPDWFGLVAQLVESGKRGLEVRVLPRLQNHIEREGFLMDTKKESQYTGVKCHPRNLTQ